MDKKRNEKEDFEHIVFIKKKSNITSVTFDLNWKELRKKVYSYFKNEKIEETYRYKFLTFCNKLWKKYSDICESITIENLKNEVKSYGKRK